MKTTNSEMFTSTDTGLDTLQPWYTTLDKAQHYLRAIYTITESMREALDAQDYERCVVHLLQRQDYVRELIIIGTQLSSCSDRNDTGAVGRDEPIREIMRRAIHRIEETITRIMTLDRVYEKDFLKKRHTLVQRMQEVANARKMVRRLNHAKSPVSRFVDLVES